MRARFDPISWSRCNLCKQKYPDDEIVQHIHQKHPDRDCSTYNCWTCGIQFKKEREMKRHMNTVKHLLEAKKLTIEEDTPTSLLERNAATAHTILETDTDIVKPSEEIYCNQILTEINTEKSRNFQKDNEDITVSTSHELITTTEDMTANEDLQSQRIDHVVHQLLEALNEDNTPTSLGEKQKIIDQYHNCEEDLVDIEIDDWLTIDSWGNTPAIEIMIPTNFEEI